MLFLREALPGTLPLPIRVSKASGLSRQEPRLPSGRGGEAAGLHGGIEKPSFHPAPVRRPAAVTPGKEGFGLAAGVRARPGSSWMELLTFILRGRWSRGHGRVCTWQRVREIGGVWGFFSLVVCKSAGAHLSARFMAMRQGRRSGGIVFVMRTHAYAYVFKCVPVYT